MRITYDKKVDAMRIVLGEGIVVKDKALSENVIAGYAKGGKLIEIQILDVSEMEHPWMNLQAAAAMLGVSMRTLQRRIDDGVIKPRKIGREFQISAEDIEKLAKTGND